MKNSFSCFLFLLLAALTHFAKGQDQGAKSTHANYILPRLGTIKPGDLIVGIPDNEDWTIVGDVYWDRHWGLSNFSLFKDGASLEDHQGRYDIHNDQFELMIGKEIKVLSGSLVKTVICKDSLTNGRHHFVNAREFVSEGSPMKGFLEILVDGKNILLKKVDLEILKSNFNPSYSMKKEIRILKKVTYYYTVNKDALKIKAVKNLKALFGSKAQEMDAFIKKENIKVKEEDLIKTFTYFSSLN